MVDRVYKQDLPALRSALVRLRTEFSKLDSKTDWVALRIDPLLRHVKSLEQLLGSQGFSREASRLTKGVAMFRSDLVYLRTNVQTLDRLLQSEQRHSGGRTRPTKP
jgi:hypothetical protein